MGLAILIVWVIILGIAILLIVSNIKIVPQAHAYVVERLGGYKETWGVGLHFKMPILDRVARRVSLKEQVVDFEPQAVITKDNVTMQIDTIVFYASLAPQETRILLAVLPETKCQRLFSTHTFHCMKKATVDFSTMAIKSFLFTFDFRQPHAQTGIGLTL